jgi:hypothetical protein
MMALLNEDQLKGAGGLKRGCGSRTDNRDYAAFGRGCSVEGRSGFEGVFDMLGEVNHDKQLEPCGDTRTSSVRKAALAAQRQRKKCMFIWDRGGGRLRIGF